MGKLDIKEKQKLDLDLEVELQKISLKGKFEQKFQLFYFRN